MKHSHGVQTKLTVDRDDWRFVLHEVVGEGASGTVWRAWDKRTDHWVAVKVAHDREAALVLAHEAETLLLTDSPHISSVIDLGRVPAGIDPVQEGSAYLALGWVPGTRLRPLAVPSGQRLGLAAALARDVGAALDDLHQAGMAHGDVKPDNILVAPEGDGFRAVLVDLGYATEAGTDRLIGATPRYAPPELARGERNAVAHDLWGLGVCLAEVIDPSIAEAADPVGRLWTSALPAPWGAWLRALTAHQPSARPSASWVRGGAAGASQARTGRGANRVRSSYLRVRKALLAAAREASTVRLAEGTAPWLGEAVSVVRSAHALRGEPPADERLPPCVLEPLDAAGRKRWLVALVGAGAVGWALPPSVVELSEHKLASVLDRLSQRQDPTTWTMLDVIRAVENDLPAPCRVIDDDGGDWVELALGLVKRPSSPALLQLAERLHHRGLLPPALQVLLAEALRSGGNLGAAFAALDGCGDPRAEVLRADLLRRMGRHKDAAELATSIVESAGTSAALGARASAVYGRTVLDLGDAAKALEIVGAKAGAAAAEVRALAHLARGEAPAAMQAVEEGLATAVDDEERARLCCVRGMEAHARGESKGAYASFLQAAECAARAGAVVEEATYQTGVAAAAVDAGYVDAALEASQRALFLWEHLGQPAKVAYALFARASALTLVGCAHDAREEAVRALGHAKEAGDGRATSLLRMLISDLGSGDEQVREATLALEVLGADGLFDDVLRAQSRKVSVIPEEEVRELDRRADEEDVSVTARVDWWSARARAWMRGHRVGRDAEIVSKLTRLVREPMPMGIKGPAVEAARALAAAAGDGETTRWLASLQVKLSLELLERVPPWLRGHAVSLPWVMQSQAPSGDGSSVDHARHLEVLVRAMSERETLRRVLDRALDALVLWTGVERGLLLLRAPGDRLVVRAARNLERRDLRDEQLELSQSLARRALDTREPVVAVDATGELAEMHRSVHVLGLRSVLAVPLLVRGEAVGVAYLDDRMRKGAFGPQELSWVRLVAGIAAMAIADAQAQVLLRREARRASRAEARVKEDLARREADLERAERALASEAGRPRLGYEAIVGESEPVRRMLSLIGRVAATDLPVLIEGESGSGKELVARALHDHSQRSSKPFVTENCSAIPEPLFESTLFGHVRGAFTGADRRRLGLFEAADGGTLFLDEVGEIPLRLQGKLLRVLQDGEVHSLGSAHSTRVDVRVIAATNRDLRELVSAGSFREDLFYRLHVVAIQVPSLRERVEDVPLLVRHFLSKYGSGEAMKVSRGAWSKLESYAWPGNVRELENEVRRALALCEGVIREEDLTAQVVGRAASRGSAAGGMNLRTRLDGLERELVEEALGKTGGNQTRAARMLGVSRYGLQKMIKRLGVG